MQTVCVDVCGGVLHHDCPVAVVDIDQRECFGGQVVEEHFLGGDVVCHGLMEVKMVVGEIAEDPPSEGEASDAVLHHTVAADLDEGIFAPCLDHAV